MTTYHATKYDSARDEVVAILASVSEGFGHLEFGDVDAPCGYVQVVDLTDACDLDFSDHTNYPAGDLAGETAREYGVTADDVRGLWLVQTGTQGFVDVARYATAEERAAVVAALDESYADWLGDE